MCDFAAAGFAAQNGVKAVEQFGCIGLCSVKKVQKTFASRHIGLPGAVPASVGLVGIGSTAFCANGPHHDRKLHAAGQRQKRFFDVRGQGGLSQDVTPVTGTTLRGHIIRGVDDPDPKKLLFRNIYLDTVRLTRLVMAMDDVDETRIGAMGGSQGGGLTLACAGLVPELNRACAVYPFLSDYRRVWNMDLAKAAYEELQYYFRQFDPTHAHEEEFFQRLGYIDVQNLAPRIRCRILMVTGLMDTVCPPSTQFAAYNKITSSKEQVFYPDFGHEWLPGSSDLIFQYMMEMLQ